MFIAKDYEASIRIRMHSYFAGKFGRKDLLRKFCTANGIEHKIEYGRKYCLPEKYLIEHKEINYLSGVRDKLILSFYDDYRDEQNKNINLQEQLKKKIDEQASIIETCKARLANNRKLLGRTKTPIDQIHYENVVESLKTRIQNEKQDKARLEYELKNIKSQFKTNLQNWNKQVEIIERLLDFRRKNFEKNISKLIRKKLNFAEFYSRFDDYSDEVKKILKGDLYE